MRNNEFTKILKWPGYRVWQWAIDEKRHELKLWVRRKSGNRKYQCSGCGRKLAQFCDFTERQVRDLPWGPYQTIVVIEVHRVRCPDCGV